MGRIPTGVKGNLRKMNYYKRAIREMYKELEGTFNNNKIVEMENDLVAKKRNLFDLYQDTQASVKIRMEQSKIINKRADDDDKTKK